MKSEIVGFSFRYIPVILYTGAIDNKFQIMTTLAHCSLAGNSRDVTIKYVHSKKHSDVNRRVVAVFKIAAFDIAGRNCLKLYAVL